MSGGVQGRFLGAPPSPGMGRGTSGGAHQSHQFSSSPFNVTLGKDKRPSRHPASPQWYPLQPGSLSGTAVPLLGGAGGGVWHREPLPCPQQGGHWGAAWGWSVAGSPWHQGCRMLLGLAGWVLSPRPWHRLWQPGSVAVTLSILARGPGTAHGEVAEPQALPLPGGGGELEGEKQRRDPSAWGGGASAAALGAGPGCGVM